MESIDRHRNGRTQIRATVSPTAIGPGGEAVDKNGVARVLDRNIRSNPVQVLLLVFPERIIETSPNSLHGQGMTRWPPKPARHNSNTQDRHLEYRFGDGSHIGNILPQQA